MSLMINNKYPVKSKEKESFSLFWIKFATVGILAYYALEMINRVYFFNPELELPMSAVNWRIIDSSIYAFTFLILAVQTALWREKLQAYENRKKARNAFITLILAAFFTALYEVLVIKMDELQHSQRSDLSVPFLFMIMLHFYSFNLVKQIVNKIGSSKKTGTGKSIFYTLFALNPCIRYLLPFLLIVLTSLGGGLQLVYTYYADLVMTYVAAVNAVGVTLYIWIDGRKIKIAHLLEALPRDIDKHIEEVTAEYQTMIKKSDISVFCPSCGIKVHDDSAVCSKCGATIAGSK